MDPALQAHAEAARGFMPPEEGLALYQAAVASVTSGSAEAPFLEVGSYCGKSAVYLGAAARAVGTVLFTVDHHRGSEENQAGWPHHEADLVDPDTGRLDTLGRFRRTIAEAGLEDVVVAVVGESATVGRHWTTPLGFLFIDGGHGAEPAARDYRTWVPHLRVGGVLAVHDVFEDPALGGQAPHDHIYRPALESGAFEEMGVTGSLRVLRRVRAGT